MDTSLPQSGPQPQVTSEPRAADVLTIHIHEQCTIVGKHLYPLAKITSLPSQGHCSSTFLVSSPASSVSEAASQFILQFRRSKFALDIKTTSAARLAYGPYAPNTRELLDFAGTSDLRVYEMDLIGGVTYKSVAPAHVVLSEAEFERQLRLVEGFANFIARGWQVDYKATAHDTGKVGAVVLQKLQLLADNLPRESLRAAARETVSAFDSLESLPRVLNHGDIVPSNIMVDPVTLQLTGLVDWAEAESLPFGTCLYGLEHLLGIMDAGIDGRPTFKYYSRASELRLHFWQNLRVFIPALATPSLGDSVLLAKQVGTLLWHGFAWDDGAIDRVVNERDDVSDIAHLEAFLEACNNDARCFFKPHRKDSVVG